MPQPTVLLVDDEPKILSSLLRCLSRLDVNIVSYDSPYKALEYIENKKPELVISDQRMPDMSGHEMLIKMKKTWPDIQAILLSAYNDFDAVADAFNKKTIDRYISKPWNNDELCFIVNKALNKNSGNKRIGNNDFSNKKSTELVNFYGMLSSSRIMEDIFDRIRRISTSNVPIFITGETGTGKELVARACHLESYRKPQPFVAVNYANFSNELIESQLFGHKKGSFTGATGDQIGLFSMAEEGTLFLDEITTLPISLQAKLLRVIQEREYSPLGDRRVLSFDAQLITASSTKLIDAVNNGEFREDLYYRLNVVFVQLPPLRKRQGDIILLAEEFLNRFNKIENKTFYKISDEARLILIDYQWPGNIRQLENILHSIVILNEGEEITGIMLQQALDDGMPLSRGPLEVFQKNNHVVDEIIPLWLVEKKCIEKAIGLCDGNIPKAAALLEISASTIYRKQKQWV